MTADAAVLDGTYLVGEKLPTKVELMALWCPQIDEEAHGRVAQRAHAAR
jgi:hypothetical protein